MNSRTVLFSRTATEQIFEFTVHMPAVRPLQALHEEYSCTHINDPGWSTSCTADWDSEGIQLNERAPDRLEGHYGLTGTPSAPSSHLQLQEDFWSVEANAVLSVFTDQAVDASYVWSLENWEWIDWHIHRVAEAVHRSAIEDEAAQVVRRGHSVDRRPLESSICWPHRKPLRFYPWSRGIIKTEKRIGPRIWSGCLKLQKGTVLEGRLPREKRISFGRNAVSIKPDFLWHWPWRMSHLR